MDFPNNFEFDSNVKSSEARDDPLKNISSRSFDSSDRTLKLPDLSHKYKPGVIAYHRVVHNVSWAITIPLFTFLLPIADSGDPTSLPNQVNFKKIYSKKRTSTVKFVNYLMLTSHQHTGTIRFLCCRHHCYCVRYSKPVQWRCSKGSKFAAEQNNFGSFDASRSSSEFGWDQHAKSNRN